jgi:DNA-directed RNA polymerase subunit H (RpoH/RPB5)
MKYFIVLLFIILLSCSNKKEVYWCGDHACISNKERKAYFKKTLITEIRFFTKQKRKKTEFEIIKEKAGLDLEKEEEFEDKIEVLSTEEQEDIAKQLRLEEKQRIKEEKDIAKQLRLEEKQRIKEGKALAKQSRLDEKKDDNRAKVKGDCTKLVKLHEKLKCKMDKRKANKAESKKTDSKIKLETSVVNEKDMDLSVEFNEFVKKIRKKNISRSYPDINAIPK